jgi:cation transport ATPase
MASSVVIDGTPTNEVHSNNDIGSVEVNVSIEEGLENASPSASTEKQKPKEPEQPGAYQEQQIKILSRAVILIAIGIFIVQIVWIILRLAPRQYYSKPNVVAFWTNFAVSICIALLMLGCSYYGAAYNNPSSACLGVGFLDIYRGVCIFGAVWYFFFSIWWAIYYSYAYSLVTFIVNIILVALCVAGEGRTDSLLKFLSAVHQNSAEEEKLNKLFSAPYPVLTL